MILMKQPKPNTKLAHAIEIVRTLGVQAKKDGMKAIQASLGMTQYGSTTYWHNARRYLEAEQQNREELVDSI